MPAYSFMPMFVEPIRAGTKGGTIRAERGRPGMRPGGHARPGEPLWLYCRQRHPGGFLIAEKTCDGVEPLRLDFGRERVIMTSRLYRRARELDRFATFDGFADFQEMRQFWQRVHDVLEFAGWHVRWLPLPDYL